MSSTPSSNETKRALMLSGAHASILRCLGSSDPQLLVYVCGLCLNLSSELEWSVLLFRVGAVARLEQLVAHEDQVVSRYATTTLLNVLALLPQLAQGAGGGSARARDDRGDEDAGEEAQVGGVCEESRVPRRARRCGR